ncbi:MAG: LysM peptidoglycan-binding domain-containing protein [Saprospiraceae bacterium]|nr:LysM peptidoglycan-binding domain-containing protein [Saprospiraceae bacterium]
MPTTSHYTVAPGDTLYGIARRFGMDVNDLMSLNGLSSSNLSVGQTLQVYAESGGQESFVPPTPPPPPSPPSWGGGSSSGSSWGSGGGYAAARQQFGVQIRPDAGFNRYTLTVPLLSGGTVTANMRDNLTNSSHLVYPQGIMYAGQSNIEVDLYSIQSVGLNPQTARALQYVSTHEGKFDAINSYDRAIFSYGFIQFVGASAHGASLNQVLASMKSNAPSLFDKVFQSVGIGVSGNVVTVVDDQGNTLQGDPAWLYIQQTVPLYGAFIQAGFEPALVLEQLRMANTLYVQPTLNARLDLNIAGASMAVTLKDIFTSEAFQTIAIAIGINQGVGGMSRNVVAPATSQVAMQTGVPDLRQIDERMVAETIAYNATDERIRSRAQGVLDSGLSFAKAGGWS